MAPAALPDLAAPLTRTALDPAVRRTLDVEARRYLAAIRKARQRAADLTRALDAAQAAGPGAAAEIARVLADVGLAREDLPADLADAAGPG